MWIRRLLALLLLLQLGAATVPFVYLPGSQDELIHSHLFTVPVRIGDYQTRFILDTGAGMNLISSELAQKLKCPSTGVTHRGQRMSGQWLTIPLTYLPSLACGDLKRTFVTTGTWDFHGFLPATPEFAGVEGFLSLKFFENAPMTLDYPSSQLILETPETLAERLRTGTAVPLRLLDEEGVSLTCFAPLNVTGADIAWVEVDTGSDSLILNSRYLKALGITPERTVQNKDETGHPFTRYFATLPTPVELAPTLRRQGLRVMFQEIIHDGLIGDDFLKHYVVTYDLAHSQLISLGAYSPQPRSSNSPYSKEQALVDLTRAENQPADAVADFKVILDCRKSDEDLRDATTGFLKLLNTYGNGDTTNVQGYYRTINQSLRPGEAREAGTASWLAVNRAESGVADVISGYGVIQGSLGANEPRAQATSDYVGLLNLEGNGATTHVQADYQAVNRTVKPGETRAQALAQFARQVKAENGPDDATANYLLVDKTARPGESREANANAFLKLLGTEGNGATSAVQSHYQLINSTLGQNEDRGQAVDQFVAQLRAENGVDDAVANYQLVDTSIKPQEDRPGVTAQFLKVLGAEGNGSTSEAQADFRTITKFVTAQHPRAELTASFLNLLHESKSPKDARSMFELAHS